MNRLQALGDVVVDSPRISGNLEVARIWFRTPAESPLEEPPSPQRQGEALFSGPPPAPDAQAKTTRYHLVAKQLHALVVLADQPLVERLDLAGGVQLTESGDGAAPPTFVLADEFSLYDGQTANPFARLVGSPARGSIRGMEFEGHQIDVRQGDNRIEIPGPGSIRIETPGTGAQQTPPIRVSWAEKMTFDGQVAHFDQQVEARGSQLTEKGDRSEFVAAGQALDVRLNRWVSLMNPDTSQQVELEDVAFDDWVSLEHTLVDRAGRTKSVDFMNVRDLTLNQTSGRVHASGPGWLVHRGPAFEVGSAARTGAPHMPIAAGCDTCGSTLPSSWWATCIAAKSSSMTTFVACTGPSRVGTASCSLPVANRWESRTCS